ncbi:YceD family protein [Propionicimonas sp. T2.31MG-18]|uniref:YceD family protein n=1 Tax=Propionicimonas sp. T2.31MG-18 TaxID=3157620 RepID=UPI00366D8F56
MPPRLPDPRSGLVLDTHELSRRAGTLKEVTRVAEAPADLGIEVIGVPPGSPVDLSLRLESVVEGVLVTGTAKVRLSGNCARCLDEISRTEEVDLQELFCYPGKELDDAEALRIEGEMIDLEPVLRDAVVLDLPFTPLCRPDCAGLCPDCGANLNRDPDHGHAEPTDPRWAGLEGWTEPTNEPNNKE